MTTRMRLLALLLCPLLLAGCEHKPAAECSRILSGMADAFNRYDTNNDGRIDRSEYYSVMHALAKTAQSEEGGPRKEERAEAQLDGDFDKLDENHDGYIRFDEFTGHVCTNDDLPGGYVLIWRRG